jgi:hypothetical protein
MSNLTEEQIKKLIKINLEMKFWYDMDMIKEEKRGS